MKKKLIMGTQQLIHNIATYTQTTIIGLNRDRVKTLIGTDMHSYIQKIKQKKLTIISIVWGRYRSTIRYDSFMNGH